MNPATPRARIRRPLLLEKEPTPSRPLLHLLDRVPCQIEKVDHRPLLRSLALPCHRSRSLQGSGLYQRVRSMPQDYVRTFSVLAPKFPVVPQIIGLPVLLLQGRQRDQHLGGHPVTPSLDPVRWRPYRSHVGKAGLSKPDMGHLMREREHLGGFRIRAIDENEGRQFVRQDKAAKLVRDRVCGGCCFPPRRSPSP